MDDYGYYQAVEFERYLARRRPASGALGGKPQVATIVGRGTILDGEQPSGTIGSDTLGGLIADATEDPDIAAIVLRLDTGGGGTFASEIVRQKVLEARAAGKPVVVSMGSVAASGGYWIASAADEIWATPTTITGSIGVFGAIPTFESLLGRAGIHTDGVGTTDVAGAFRGDRPLQPEVGSTFQATVDYYYELFVGHIVEGRELPRDEVYALANGGVYLGRHARELGLVDNIGGRREAVNAAARLAGLGDDFEEILFEEPPSPRELFLRQLAGNNAGVLAGYAQPWVTLLESWAAPLRSSLRILDSLSDPNRVYAHCLVCVAP
jgi:protease-4